MFRSVTGGIRGLALPLSLVSLVVATMRQDPAPSPGVVTATAFRLVRPDGSLAGVWAANEKLASLDLRDGRGDPRIQLLVADGGFVGAVLLDPEGQPRSLWSTTEAGESAFVINGKGQVPRVAIRGTADAEASVVVHDAKGVRRCFGGVLDNGAAAYTLFAPDDQVVATMSTPVDGSGSNASFVLYDPKRGSMRAAMSVGQTGEPMISLHGEREQLRSSWSLAGGGGALAWMNDANQLQAVYGTSVDGTAGLKVFDARGELLLRAPENFDQAPADRRGRSRGR